MTAEFQARVEAVTPHNGGWHSLSLRAPVLAGALAPGHGVVIDGAAWPVIRADPDRDHVACLGAGGVPPALGALCPVSGPVGHAFDAATASPRALLVGHLAGLAPLVFLAHRLHRAPGRIKVLMLLEIGPGIPPFSPQPSRMIVPDLPSWVTAAIPLCEDWGLPSRLAAPAGAPGCFDGPVTNLAGRWLETLQGTADVTLFGCGAGALLEQLGQLARRHGLSHQLHAPPDSG